MTERRDKIAAALAATGVPVEDLFFTWHGDREAGPDLHFVVFATRRNTRGDEIYVVWETTDGDECRQVRREMEAIAQVTERMLAP